MDPRGGRRVILATLLRRARPPEQRVDRKVAEQEGTVIPLSFKIATVIVYVIILLPIAVVVLMSLNAGEALTFPPQGLSLRWIRNFFAVGALRRAFLYSMRISFGAAVIGTVVGTMAGIWLARALRARTKAAALILAVLLTPIILPGIAVGFSLFVLFRNLGLSNSTWALTLAHSLVATPFAAIVVAATAYGLDPQLEEASRSLGSGPWRTFRKVTFPLAAPGVLAGFLFGFIVSFGQSGLALFITPLNESTLPLALYSYLRYQFDPTPAAAGTFSILLVIVTVILLNWLTPMGRLSGMRQR